MIHGKRIISLVLAALVLNLQLHIFESAIRSQDDNYSMCSIECEHNEHAIGKLDCEVCLKNVRFDFVLNNMPNHIGNENECLHKYNSNVIFNNFAVAYASRAPPSILL